MQVTALSPIAQVHGSRQAPATPRVETSESAQRETAKVATAPVEARPADKTAPETPEPKKALKPEGMGRVVDITV